MTSSATRTPLGLTASMPMSVELAHLFDMRVELARPQVVASPAGNHMIFVAQGGTVEGARVRGVVLPGGGDWIRTGTDRVGRIDVRATIRTHDGALIHLTNTGRIALSDEGLAKLAADEDVAWDQGYVRSAPLFETGAPSYLWLNSVATVAINEIGPGYVNYRVLEIR